MDFIQYLPIKQKYKDVLVNNFSSDLSLFRNFGIISLQKFMIFNVENDYTHFMDQLHEYTISFIGYTTFILDREILPGVGYGTSYILLNEFYKEYKKKIEKKNIKVENNYLMHSDPINIDFHDLLTNGVIVIPGPENIRKGLNKFNKEQIEFVNPEEKECILGGFGAYGNPTSFHHPFIRNIRKVVHDYLWESLKKTFPGKRAELLLDRFSKRRKGTTTSVETWHRDIAPVIGSNIKEGDIIYGGWINLDKEGLNPQQFSCVPGTQTNDILKKGGFVKFSSEEMKNLNKKKKIFEIPPGHIIMFNQNIAHEILKKTAAFNSYRLFIGWRITDSKKPLFDNKKIIEDQGIIRLPSGQIPPMYSPSHWMFHRDKLVEWSKRVKPEFREKKLFKKEGIYLDVVQEHMISLKESGLEMWPEYSDYDKEILTPMKL